MKRLLGLACVLLALGAAAPLAAAPAHRYVYGHVHRRAPLRRHVKRRIVRKKAPPKQESKTPRPVCHRKVIRVRTGAVIKLVPKERCF